MRVDNYVSVMGRVIKGPFLRYTSAGKARVSYQIQITARSKDKGAIQMPFVKSVGNQAEKDKVNIKTGDLVIVTGRIITRQESKEVNFVKDENDPQKLIQINLEDEECPNYDDEEIFTGNVVRQVSEIMASDVFYFHKFVQTLDEKDQLKLFSERILRLVKTDNSEETDDENGD